MGKTLSDLRSAQAQLGTFLQSLNEQRMQIDGMIGNRSILQNMANSQKQLLNLQTEIDRCETNAQQVMTLITKSTGCLDFDSAATWYTDLRVRIEQAGKMFDTWRRMKAIFDLNKALGNFAADVKEGLTEEDAENQLIVAQHEYQVALDLAAERAPTVSTSLIEIAR